MIKVKVQKGNIVITGHANYSDYGTDIVCASVSSIVMCSVEAIASFNADNVDVIEVKDKLEITYNDSDFTTDKLITNMLNCLSELAKQYPKNIKIIDREE